MWHILTVCDKMQSKLSKLQKEILLTIFSIDRSFPIYKGSQVKKKVCPECGAVSYKRYTGYIKRKDILHSLADKHNKVTTDRVKVICRTGRVLYNSTCTSFTVTLHNSIHRLINRGLLEGRGNSAREIKLTDKGFKTVNELERKIQEIK